MSLPPSGPLKMSQINAELKFLPLTRTGLGSVAIRNLGKKTTGRISFSDLLGKSSRILTTKIFYSSSTWTAPSTTTSLITLAGQGGVGSTGYSYISGYTMVKTVQTSAFIPPYPSIYTEIISTVVTESPTTASATVPSISSRSYYLGPSTGTVAQTQPGYRYEATTYEKRTDYVTVSDSYGGDAYAFNKYFTGTYGSPAVRSTYYDQPVTPGTTYSISVPAGGVVTFTYEEDAPTYTVVTGTLTAASGQLTIPANATVSLTGKGGPGSYYTTPATPYVPYSKTLISSNQHGRNEAQGLDAPYPCSDTPGSEGPTNVRFQTIGTNKYVYWDCPTYKIVQEQQAQPAGYYFTTGASTTATLNGVTKTFVGGSGGVASEVTASFTATTSAQTLTYSIPSGGSLSYSYQVPI